MPSYFFDTSALVKRYYDEQGTDVVDAIIEPAEIDIFPALKREDSPDLGYRDKGQVSRDLETLARQGVISFETDGRAKKPYLQHEHVVVEPIV